MKRQIIFVLGMHRSGTSAVSRGLKALGVELGDNLMPPVPNDNETGFWEDIDFNSLNEEILALIGCNWNSSRLIEPGELTGQAFSSLRLRALELLNHKIGKSDKFGIKNPRMCRTMPFWQQVMSHCDFEDQYVIAVRNPLSVARSLAARNGFSVEKSHLLWLGHMIPTMMETKGKRRVVVDYDLLMNDPIIQMERIARGLNIVPDGNTEKELTGFAEDFLSQELRHTQFDIRHFALDSRLPRLAADAYGHLLKLAQDIVSPEASECIDTWNHISEIYLSMAPVYSLLDREESILAEHEGQIAASNKAIADKDTHIRNLGVLIEDKSTHIISLETALDEKRGLIEEQAEQIQAKDLRIQNIEYELSIIKHSRVWRAAEALRSLFYIKILGHFPLLQQSALTISRAGFSVFYQKTKRKLKRYLWRSNHEPKISDSSPSETASIKSMEAKTYVPLTEFKMKAEKEVIRKKLREVIDKIEKKRGM
ncbi:MAG: hypothetical protein WC560_01655 [Syntrophales bacterium]